ncbi:MAG: hypothetical protein Q4D34_04345 [Eggerthellaceae bacterium]|nr:hypothetical protein [Eggerthellaceae bacterium]
MADEDLKKEIQDLLDKTDLDEHGCTARIRHEPAFEAQIDSFGEGS